MALKCGQSRAGLRTLKRDGRVWWYHVPGTFHVEGVPPGWCQVVWLRASNLGSLLDVGVLVVCIQELLLAGCPTGFVSAVGKINALSGASDVVQRMVGGQWWGPATNHTCYQPHTHTPARHPLQPLSRQVPERALICIL